MSDLAATVATLKPGMRVRATFRRTGHDAYIVEGTLYNGVLGGLTVGGSGVRVRSCDGPCSNLVAVEVLTPKFEIGAWYEHPDEPGLLWQRCNNYFETFFGNRRRDTDRTYDAWRAGLRRVPLPSEQQEQWW